MGGNREQHSSNRMALVIGYHKIRGLGAPLRMICYYKSQPFTNVAYGEDMSDAWHKGKKLELIKQNSCINLPYIIDGDFVTTQSNTRLLHPQPPRARPDHGLEE